MATLQRNDEEKTLELFIDGDFCAGWDSEVYKFSDKQIRMIAQIADTAFQQGKRARSKEFRKLIGA